MLFIDNLPAIYDVCDLGCGFAFVALVVLLRLFFGFILCVCFVKWLGLECLLILLMLGVLAVSFVGC